MRSSAAALNGEVKEFVARHPHGWDHGAWLTFLDSLAQKGFDVSNQEEIGLRLESLRIQEELERRNIQGLGPKRTESLANHFRTWWHLCHASEHEIAEAPKVTTPVARKVRAAI